nr:uncharacterized protein LOC113811407 [Penaeus vannamei]
MSREAPTEKHYVHRRAGHVMISYDKRLFVWGGYMELAHTHPYTLTTHSKCIYHSASDVWIYEPLLDVWKRKTKPWRYSSKLFRVLCSGSQRSYVLSEVTGCNLITL